MAMPTAAEVEQGRGSRQAIRGEVGGRQVLITPSGKVLVDGQVADGILGMEEALGVSDDEVSGGQVDATISMIGKAFKMMLWADPSLVARLQMGEVQLESVLDEAGVILNKMAQSQQNYEEHRLRIAQLDTAQAALESVSALARSTNFIAWMRAPAEIKRIAEEVLGDARRTNAIVLASSVDSEKMALGLENYNQMVEAAANAALEQQLVNARAQNQRAVMLETSNHESELRRLGREREEAKNRNASRQATLDLVASALSRSGEGIVDLVDVAAEKITTRLVGDDGILSTIADGVSSLIAKGKEPHVVGFLAGGVGGLIEGTILVGMVAVGGPITWVPLVIVVGSGLTGGALGARSPEFFAWLGDKLTGTRLGRLFGLNNGQAQDGQLTRPAPPPSGVDRQSLRRSLLENSDD